MSTQPNRTEVVVSGIGACASIGANVQTYWEALAGSRSGITKLLIESPFGEGKGAPIADLKHLSVTQKISNLLVQVIDEAIENAGLSHAYLTSLNAGQFAVVGGSNFSDSERWCVEGDFYKPIREVLNEKGLLKDFWGLSTACATGVGAIGLARDLIKYENIPLVLVCCYDVIEKYNYKGLASLRALSADEVRPFDKNRDGTLLGEGAGALVVESKQHAINRGAKIRAWVPGYGISNDGHHFTAPEPSGLGMRLAMTQALDEAELNKKDIKHLNAHGTGTKHNDRIESFAIKTVFESWEDKIPVTSLKATIGHCMGASGMLECIAALIGMEKNVIPATLNYQMEDPECPLDYVRNESRESELETVMCNSYGLWGCNASVIFSRSIK